MSDKTERESGDFDGEEGAKLQHKRQEVLKAKIKEASKPNTTLKVVGLKRTEENILPADNPWLSAGAQSLLGKNEEKAKAKAKARRDKRKGER